MTHDMREALAELVALKDLKDRLHQLHEQGHGTDYDDYHRRKPLAWAAARSALSAAPEADTILRELVEAERAGEEFLDWAAAFAWADAQKAPQPRTAEPASAQPIAPRVQRHGLRDLPPAPAAGLGCCARGVRITSSRIDIDGQTFAVRNIGSVKVTRPGRPLLAAVVLVFGLALLAADSPVAGLIIAGAAAAWIYQQMRARSLVLVSGGGEQTALRSTDAAHIETVRSAIAQAIAGR